MIVQLLLATAVIPAGQSFNCTPTRVWDGDGPIWCAEGAHVRLSGVAAKEMDGTCKTGHPCPDADPMEARDALVQLIGRPIGRLYLYTLIPGLALFLTSRLLDQTLLRRLP